MNRFFLRVVVTFLLLFAFAGPGYGQSGGPVSSDDPPPPQVVMPVLNYHLALPVVSRPDPSGLIGPFGGSVVVIVADPSDPAVIYAGTWGAGVYKSSDSGINWRPARTGLTNLLINSMAIDPLNHQVVYAGTYKNGVFKSVDGGESWTRTSNGIQNSAIVYSMAVDPENSNRIYIGTRGENTNGQPPWRGVLYKSDDGAASWKPVLENIGGSGAQDWIYSLAILPRDPNMILAASHEHGPYLSMDYGKTWAPSSSGITDGSGRAVLFDPSKRDPATAFFGVWHRSGIFKSTDNASTWTAKTSGIGNTKIYSMAIDSLNPDHLYATTFIASSGDTGGVLHSSDSGNTWHPAGMTGFSIYTVAVNPANSDRLYAGVYNTGLFRSDNRGASWGPSQNGLSNLMVSAVLVRPGAPSEIYAGTSTVIQTNNRGASWSTLGSGIPTGIVNAMAMSPANANILFALTQSSGLYRVDLGAGGSWNKQIALPSSPTLQSDPRPWQPVDELHMLMPDEPVEARPAAVPNTPLLAMSFAPSNAGIAYLGSSGSGVYRSSDGGSTWNPAGLQGQVVTSLAVDSANPDVVYAASGASGTVKWSTNGGQTWTDTPLPAGTIPYALSISSADPDTVYAGTSSGLYKRVSNGAWTLNGLAGQAITAVTAHPSQAGVLFAGSTAGAFFSGDNGLSWSPGPEALSVIGIKSIVVEPLTGKYVYYATNSSGVYMQYFQ